MGFFFHATEYFTIQILSIKINNNVHFKGLIWGTQRYITNLRKKIDFLKIQCDFEIDLSQSFSYQTIKYI